MRPTQPADKYAQRVGRYLHFNLLSCLYTQAAAATEHPQRMHACTPMPMPAPTPAHASQALSFHASRRACLGRGLNGCQRMRVSAGSL